MLKSFVVVVSAAALATWFVACGSSNPTPDAMKDASASNIAFGSACTTVSDTSTECASHVCTNTFNMFPTPVCSQKCTMLGGSDTTCPQGSMGQKCNMQGYCRP
jgi:hypothetical protein